MARKTTYGKGTRYGDYAPKYRWGSWGKAFLDYTELRDIYPREFYQKIVNRGLCIDGQSVLDVGTGTGVLPGNMYPYGAKWTAVDISENQIEQAKILAHVKA